MREAKWSDDEAEERKAPGPRHRLRQPAAASARLLLSARRIRPAAPPPPPLRCLFRTHPADQLRSPVLSLDLREGLLACAGHDATLRLLRASEAETAGYVSQRAIHLESRPLHLARFLDPARLLCAFDRGGAGLLDLASERLLPLHKLWPASQSLPAGAAPHPRRALALLFAARHTCLVDARAEGVTLRADHAHPLRAATFLNEHVCAAAFTDAQVRLFDLRRGLAQPVSTLRGDHAVLAGDESLLVGGGRGGAVQLYAWREGGLGRTLRPLRADVTALSVSGQHIAAASAWQAEGVRLLSSDGVTVPGWPTGRARLGTVTSLCAAEGHLALGNSLGRVSLYRLHPL